MLNKVCLVAKTKWWYEMRWYEQNEICVQSAGQESILISRQDVFTNPLERYNT